MSRTISVLTTLYNHESFIQDTLKSALEQTLSPDEIIVIDDGSDDNSLNNAMQVVHPSVHIFSEKGNLGGPTTMKGLNLCKGRFIAILNSDDTWSVDKLERQVQYLRGHPNCGAVFTHVNLIDECSRPWKAGRLRHQQIFETINQDRHAWLRHFFHAGNPFCASSALIRRECFERLGPLDGRYAQLQDLEFWVRMVVSGYDIHVIQEKLTNYRLMRNGSNMSAGSRAATAINIFEYAKLLRNFWGIKSINELQRIFPQLPMASDANDSLILFYLARHAAAQSTLQHQLFALETMSQWGGNLEARELANRIHGFTHKDYQEFLASGPISGFLRRDKRERVKYLVGRLLPYALQQHVKSVLIKRKS